MINLIIATEKYRTRIANINSYIYALGNDF